MVEPNHNPYSLLQVPVLAIGAVLAVFLWQGWMGFSLWDEGFLWYGSQRTLLGEVPIRDFMAYDPGRYYWSAFIMWIVGDHGIITQRIALYLFQALGLLIALFLIGWNCKEKKYSFLIVVTTILIAWMLPRHKLFDITVSIMLVAGLAYLISKPVYHRYFLTGLLVGLSAVVGRNHGLYGLIGSFGVFALLAFKNQDKASLFKGMAYWAAGIIIGYAPVWFMFFFVPGFANAFWESILFLFEVKTTNLPLPIPWPWRVDFSAVDGVVLLRQILIGLFFVLLPVFAIFSVGWIFWQRLSDKGIHPVVTAAAFMALPYSHYAYSRADVSHLAQGIFPTLIGFLVYIASLPNRTQWSIIAVLVVSSFLVVYPYHPGWQCRYNMQCEEILISNTKLQAGSSVAGDIELLRRLSEKYTPNGESFLATPFWPGAYALLERKSPVWEIYALFPRSATFENKEIERIKAAAPRFVVIFDLALDQRDELRFKNTHPLTFQYIQKHFERTADFTETPYLIYTSKKY